MLHYELFWKRGIFMEKTKSKMKGKSMLLCALFCALIAVGAFIKIPMPPVPFTLQVFFVAMAGLLLGPRNGAIAALVYVLLGLVGLPVFTKPAGPQYIFEPTFGYILGFVLDAFVTGWISRKSSDFQFFTLLVASLLGVLCSFLIGVPYFYVIMNLYIKNHMAISAVLYSAFLLFLPADIILMVIAALLGKKLLPILKKSDLVY